MKRLIPGKKQYLYLNRIDLIILKLLSKKQLSEKQLKDEADKITLLLTLNDKSIKWDDCISSNSNMYFTKNINRLVLDGIIIPILSKDQKLKLTIFGKLLLSIIIKYKKILI